MLNQETIGRIRARVERVTGIVLPYEVSVTTGEGLCVRLEGSCAQIAAEDENALARGFFLLGRCVKEGKAALDVCQRRHFASCGAMVDVSRGAVMKVEAVKRYIDHLAALGMNLLMLYTEDTYEVPEYPYMGYLRGRYSQKDLMELDAYAAEMGVELVPCIQTLGHMRQYLQWNETEHLRDQKDILMIDDERTYELIEAMIRSMRAYMKTDRIHIGMDEAHGVGLGNYLLRHGQTDRFDLLNRHLDRVVKICEKYDFRPIMWSDMFFRLGSKKNDYYDIETDIPQSVIDAIPPVDLCYWDYYHDDAAFYDHMLTQHARMGGRTVFAGGNWTWSGFLPHVKMTEATMRPALCACAKHKVDTVFATMWGDDGAETNLFLASSMLPLFSEACWQGQDCPAEEVFLAGECLTGLPREAFAAMGEFYPNGQDIRTGKGIIWCDPLYPLMNVPGDTLDAAMNRGQAALAVLKKYADRLDCSYAAQVFVVMNKKAALLGSLRERYMAGDRAWLAQTAEETIPQLICEYDKLMHLHRELWERDMKRFGWEVISLRYGAVMGRLDDAADVITRYLAGDMDTIEELDAEPMNSWRGTILYETMVTPSADMGLGF